MTLLRRLATLALALAVGTVAAMDAAGQEILGGPGTVMIGPLIEANSDNYPTVFRYIDRKMNSTRWPLVADTAYIGCARWFPRESIIVVIDGTPWAVNAESKKWVLTRGALLIIDGKVVPVSVGSTQEPWLATIEADSGLQKSAALLLEVAKRLGCSPKPGP